MVWVRMIFGRLVREMIFERLSRRVWALVVIRLSLASAAKGHDGIFYLRTLKSLRRKPDHRY